MSKRTTGYKDRNGVDIYVGDKIEAPTVRPGVVGEVIYDNSDNKFYIKSVSGGDFPKFELTSVIQSLGEVVK